MLSIDKDASVEEVQAAYFQLAKAWHPDRIPAPLLDVKEQCATVFSHMSEAHQTLTDPKRRAQYMTLLKEGGATPDDQAQIQLVLEAATNFQKAEICLRRSDLTQAEALCRKANEADPKQPEYLALLAWLESMKPENQSPAATQTCIAKLDQALAVNDRCERAYFYRGMLNKRVGNAAGAVRDFRRAAELNPRNIDAVREVRLFEMRKGRTSVPPPPTASVRPPGRTSEAPPGGSKSKRDSEPSLSRLFGKLFKK
jgi:tetratricopeptide (TPR) repeat protein